MVKRIKWSIIKNVPIKYKVNSFCFTISLPRRVSTPSLVLMLMLMGIYQMQQQLAQTQKWVLQIQFN